MKKWKLKQIYKHQKENLKAMLMNKTTIEGFYPTIAGNDSNFLDDYETLETFIDKNFILKHGEKIFESDEEDIEDASEEWIDICNCIIVQCMDAFARMYYAMTSDYNPLWNVDGKETTTYGATHREEHYPDTETESTNAQRTVTSTNYSTTYDSNTEKESGKNETLTPSGTDRVKLKDHTNEFDSDEYDVTIKRQGNIGVTKSTELIRDSVNLSLANQFFDILFNKIIVESGVYYD